MNYYDEKKKNKNLTPTAPGATAQTVVQPRTVTQDSSQPVSRITQPTTQSAAQPTATPATTPTSTPKTRTDLYFEYKDHPRTAEIVAEEQAKEARRRQTANVDWRAIGRAGYENIVMADEATKSARQAGSNAYDAARRGAGGAGTSYAAMAGTRAYNEAYAGVREREAAEEAQKKAEEEAAEAQRKADEQAYRQGKQEASAFVYANYSADDEAYLRSYLLDAGLSAEDADAIMATAKTGWDKRQATADKKAHTDALAELESMFMSAAGTDEDMRQLRFYKDRNNISDEEYYAIFDRYAPDWEVSKAKDKAESQKIMSYLIEEGKWTKAELLQAATTDYGLTVEEFDALYTPYETKSQEEAAVTKQAEANDYAVNAYLANPSVGESSLREALKQNGYDDFEIDNAIDAMQEVKTAQYQDAGKMLMDAWESENMVDIQNALAYLGYDTSQYTGTQLAYESGYILMEALTDTIRELGTDSEEGMRFAGMITEQCKDDLKAYIYDFENSKKKTADLEDTAEGLINTLLSIDELVKKGCLTQETADEMYAYAADIYGSTGMDENGVVYIGGVEMDDLNIESNSGEEKCLKKLYECALLRNDKFERNKPVTLGNELANFFGSFFYKVEQ